MLFARVVVLLWLGGAVSGLGCKGSVDGVEASSAADPAAVKAQQDLMKRRDALLAQRARLEGERQKIVDQIVQTEASGGDRAALAALTQQRDELTSQIEGQSTELGQMSDKLTNLSSKLDSAAAIAIREDRIAQREERVARRENQLSDRERVLAAREDRLAQREKDTCGAAPLVIQQVAAKPDGKYSKADVQPLLARARAAMAKKGVLPTDLLGPSQNLESESTRAMADGDWGKAYFAAAQLVATVDAVKIDRAFIQAKTARLSAQIKTRRSDEPVHRELTSALPEVMQSYNDGNFAAANQRLNQLAALLK